MVDRDVIRNQFDKLLDEATARGITLPEALVFLIEREVTRRRQEDHLIELARNGYATLNAEYDDYEEYRGDALVRAAEAAAEAARAAAKAATEAYTAASEWWRPDHFDYDADDDYYWRHEWQSECVDAAAEAAARATEAARSCRVAASNATASLAEVENHRPTRSDFASLSSEEQGTADRQEEVKDLKASVVERLLRSAEERAKEAYKYSYQAAKAAAGATFMDLWDDIEDDFKE